MPNKVRIITNSVSEGARALGDTLSQNGVDVSRVRASDGPKRPVRLNIKWGCFPLNPFEYGGYMVNARASDISLNKFYCFNKLSEEGVNVPEYTDSQEVAQGWLDNGCRRVYQRNLLRASEGEGIVVVDKDRNGNYCDDVRLSAAPLYVKGLFGQRREYRIHVFSLGGVRRVFIQQKKRRVTDVETTTTESRIRNLANGWIFAHNDITAPRQQTIDLAVAAVAALSLNFGGVDLIEMHEHAGGSYILEVNCAPGLQGATLEFYSSAITDYCNGVVDPTPPEEEEVTEGGFNEENDDDEEDDNDDY